MDRYVALPCASASGSHMCVVSCGNLFFSIDDMTVFCLSCTFVEQIPLEGFGTPYTAAAAADGAFIPEVYIDGNEVPGRARLRVGTAALHDGRYGFTQSIVLARVLHESVCVLVLQF